MNEMALMARKHGTIHRIDIPIVAIEGPRSAILDLINFLHTSLNSTDEEVIFRQIPDLKVKNKL